MLYCKYKEKALRFMILLLLATPSHGISGSHRSPDKQVYSKYMVSIRTRQPRKYFGDNHFCAGSIISRDEILTTAHCVMDKRKVLTRPRRMLIIAGTPHRLRYDNTTVQFGVKQIIANTNFYLHNTNDIALIRIKGEIPEDNDFIQIISLPTKPPPYGKNCTVIGWGRLYYRGPLAGETTHVDVKIYTKEECDAHTPRSFDGMLCAGDTVLYNEDPCRGDSGGPLICDGVLTGVVAWTIGCGSKTYPSIYTDVYYNLEWIKYALNSVSTIKHSALTIYCCTLIFICVGNILSA